MSSVGVSKFDNAAGVAPPHRRYPRHGCPTKRVTGQPHNRLTDAWECDEAVRHLRHAHLRAAETKRVDEDELAHEPRLLEGDLERDPPPERRPNERHRAKAAVFYVATDEAREIGNRVADARLVGAAVARQGG